MSNGSSLLKAHAVDNNVNDPDFERADFERADEECLTCDVPDDALEAASAACMSGVPTVMHSSYCFTCPMPQ
jgi:hypothetical protein